ncbi:MAG: hypothetical protein HZB76_02445 [Chlamydiae bacterium]|nr:hypothetical protein [Chlamydiota bacterium]
MNMKIRAPLVVVVAAAAGYIIKNPTSDWEKKVCALALIAIGSFGLWLSLCLSRKHPINIKDDGHFTQVASMPSDHADQPAMLSQTSQMPPPPPPPPPPPSTPMARLVINKKPPAPDAAAAVASSAPPPNFGYRCAPLFWIVIS